MDFFFLTIWSASASGSYVEKSITYLLTFQSNYGTLAANSKLQVRNLIPFP